MLNQWSRPKNFLEGIVSTLNYMQKNKYTVRIHHTRLIPLEQQTILKINENLEFFRQQTRHQQRYQSWVPKNARGSHEKGKSIKRIEKEKGSCHSILQKYIPQLS